jgi:hypothetical protein
MMGGMNGRAGTHAIYVRGWSAFLLNGALNSTSISSKSRAGFPAPEGRWWVGRSDGENDVNGR